MDRAVVITTLANSDTGCSKLLVSKSRTACKAGDDSKGVRAFAVSVEVAPRQAKHYTARINALPQQPPQKAPPKKGKGRLTTGLEDADEGGQP